MESLNEIIYESINNDYGYGKYLSMKVIIMKSNGYINTSKICREYGKELSTWIRSK